MLLYRFIRKINKLILQYKRLLEKLAKSAAEVSNCPTHHEKKIRLFPDIIKMAFGIGLSKVIFIALKLIYGDYIKTIANL